MNSESWGVEAREGDIFVELWSLPLPQKTVNSGFDILFDIRTRDFNCITMEAHCDSIPKIYHMPVSIWLVHR